MDIIYRITYIPHLDSNNPKFYIGSKKQYNKSPHYMGSISSVKKFPFTEEMSLCEWWKHKIKTERHNFKFEILESFIDIDKNELVKIEKEYHEKYNVLSEEYFNQSIATLGWVSTSKNEDTKKKLSESTKKYWQTEDGEEKKKRLIERNKTHMSNIMTEKWKNPTDNMKSRITPGRPKGSKNKIKRKNTERKINIDGIVYSSANEASKIYKIHPVNVRRRCRDKKYPNWNYDIG